MSDSVHVRFAHGMGDCSYFALLATLYRRHGIDVRVSGDENKQFIWRAACLEPTSETGPSVDHQWLHPSSFWNLNDADCSANKTAGNINVSPLPEIDAPRSELWRELCGMDLDAAPHISPEIHAEAEKFLAGLPPGPIVALHAEGTNSRDAKRIDPQTQIELQQQLTANGINVVVLDYDGRAVAIGHERVRGIKPAWGHISIDRLAALLSRCNLLIGVDSGPLNFARAFCRVPLLGVYLNRDSLLPHRVAIPSKRLMSLVPRSLDEVWQDRIAQGLDWKFTRYSGDAPTAIEIFEAAMSVIDGTSACDAEQANRHSVIGKYTYRRIGHDQRPVELRADGTIDHGSQTGNNERRWRLLGDGRLEIRGDAGVIAICSHDSDQVWRGRWTQFEKMPIEFVPGNRVAAPVRVISHHSEHRGLHYFPTSALCDDAIALSRQLPSIRAVAGVPRSGMIPAAAIALELNVPMVSLDSLLRSEPPPSTLRRRTQVDNNGCILVVDDTAAAGLQMSQLRERLPHVKTAVLYCDERATDVVDFYHSRRGSGIYVQEWTLFHDDNNEFIVTDMDGVLCDDWTGGDEESNPDAYMDFLKNTKPRRVPTTSEWQLMAIVTGRMEKHRSVTEEWLSRHNIRYSALVMSPHSNARDRDASDVPSMKAREYMSRPTARVFVESCKNQARRIKELTGRPVLCIETNSLV